MTTLALSPSKSIRSRLDEVRKALVATKDLDGIKKIRDQAEALRAYVKAQRGGLVAQNECAEVKLVAERRAGELLAGMEKNKGGRNGNRSHDATGSAKSMSSKGLKDIGLSKTESSRWQQEASLSESVFESYVAKRRKSNGEITQAGLLKLVKNRRKKAHRKAKAARKRVPTDNGTTVAEKAKNDSIRLIEADIEKADVESGSVDWIITDPPYSKKHLDCYVKLSKFAERVLKPDGSLICMTGQSYLPEIIKSLSEHLVYNWTLAYLTPGGQAVQVWDRKVNTFWKPLLWFVKSKPKDDRIGDVCKSAPIGDLCKSAPNDNDKRYHEWGQSESGMTDIVKHFTYPNEIVCDPFMGAGTTGVVCARMKRKFIGIDVDAQAVETAAKRIGAINER